MIDTDAWLEIWSSPTAQPIVDICHPDLEVHAVTLGIEGRHYQGHDGVRQWMRDIRDRFHARTVPESMTPLADDAVLMTGTLYMDDETTGGQLEQRFAMVIHLEDDKARWIGTFISASDAREAYESGVTGPRSG